MATFAGTLVFDSNPKSDKSANGTVVFSHVTAVVRHVMVYAATAEEALDSASRAFPR